MRKMNLSGNFYDCIFGKRGEKTVEFEELLKENYPPLERFVRFRIRNSADADDIIQEICLAAMRSFDSLADKNSFKAWIIGIARHKCNDYYRNKPNEPVVSLESVVLTIPDRNIFGLTYRSDVSKVIDRLGEKDRQILKLFFFHNMPQKEISEKLNIPLGTVKSRLHTAKENFKAKYPYNEKSKGEITMKKLPDILPEYSIKPLSEEPFETLWEEVFGWMIVPRIGESVVFGEYDIPSRKLNWVCEMKAEREAEIHGVRGVEISCAMDHTDPPFERSMTLVAQLTDTHCRYLAQGQVNKGVYRLRTFLDGEKFTDDWGFGEDNCGQEIHLKKKGIIERNGNDITTDLIGANVTDVVGRYTVTIAGKEYDTVCVFNLNTWNTRTAVEQYVDKNGRTVLWRRFNQDKWAFEEYGKTWSEMFPDNERLTVNGETYVHWYDSISDYIL